MCPPPPPHTHAHTHTHTHTHTWTLVGEWKDTRNRLTGSCSKNLVSDVPPLIPSHRGERRCWHRVTVPAHVAITTAAAAAAAAALVGTVNDGTQRFLDVTFGCNATFVVDHVDAVHARAAQHDNVPRGWLDKVNIGTARYRDPRCAEEAVVLGHAQASTRGVAGSVSLDGVVVHGLSPCDHGVHEPCGTHGLRALGWVGVGLECDERVRVDDDGVPCDGRRVSRRVMLSEWVGELVGRKDDRNVSKRVM
jgi:hypothetical protein